MQVDTDRFKYILSVALLLPIVSVSKPYENMYCYMTPIKTSSNWLKLACTGCDKSLCQTVMSSGLYVRAERQLKIDYPKSSPCDMTFFTAT